MAKSAYQLMKEGKDWRDVGNPQLKQQLRQLQQQNYQAQLRQVNANFQAGLAQGLTPGQAATSWVLPTPTQQYTVKDGDNLSTIASATGSSPDAILNANPDMKAPETGMILKTPAFQAPTATGGGGVGLPSNAALGATTTNPQGSNYFQSEKFGAPITQTPTGPHTSSFANSPLMKGLSFFNKTPNPNAAGLATSKYAAAGIAPQPHTPYRETAAFANNPYVQYVNPKQAGVTSPTTATPNASPNQPSLIGGLPNAAGISRKNLTASALRLLDKVNQPDYTPTPAEVQALLRFRMLNPNSPLANGGMNGNYSYSAMNKRFGRGGGGGGAPRIAMPSQPRYNPDDNLPAFSNGGGFRGLVNWRI